MILLAVIYVAAFVAREVAERLRIPGLVGEIGVGILLGPAVFAIIPAHNEAIEALAELGVIFLLFHVGVETDPRELRRVGRIAILVALAGFVLPFFLGAGFILGFEGGSDQAIFMGAAMVATSVGITARVLQEKGKLATREARVILGAAVADDILTLLLLGVIRPLATGTFKLGDFLFLILVAFAFVVLVGEFGRRAMNRYFPQVARLRMSEPALGLAILVALVLAASAGLLGLAPIIGAFLAGVILGEGPAAEHELEEKTFPLTAFFVPFFFVHVGTLVELEPLATRRGIFLVVVVTVLAIIGKLVGCGLAAWSMGRRSALIVGFGMAPRGEVGIIVASIGLSLGIIEAELYGVVVLMSIITSVIAPPILSALYKGGEDTEHPPDEPSPKDDDSTNQGSPRSAEPDDEERRSDSARDLPRGT